jgi:hypothetical protein
VDTESEKDLLLVEKGVIQRLESERMGFRDILELV